MRLKQVTACLALALSACAQTTQPVGNHSYQVGHVAAQQAEAQAPGFQFAPWVSDAERAEFLRQYNSDPVALEDPERIELRKIQHELANAISYLDTIRP
jgi:hypothetical protein